MTWLSKFRISTALDADKPLPPKLQRQIACSDPLRTFAEAAALLDRALKSAPPEPLEVPPWRHASIMHAVRAADNTVAPRREPRLWRWLPAPALAVALLVAGALLWPQSPKPSPVGPAAYALRAGTDMAHSGPSVLLSPLSDELQHLKKDLDNTARFLLTSLP